MKLCRIYCVPLNGARALEVHMQLAKGRARITKPELVGGTVTLQYKRRGMSKMGCTLLEDLEM